MAADTAWKTREREILRLLAEGLTNREIAARLHLGHETVRWYNKRIFQKLGAGNRLQAVSRASKQGLLDAPPRPEPAPPLTPPPVRYVLNGDVNIAYQVTGSGPIDLLFIHGFLSHLELAWHNPEFAGFFEQLGRFARVILFDRRGVGLSDRIQGAPTLENTIEDACCVLDAVGSQQAYIMGTSEGGAAAVLLASTYPERVLGLILAAATPKVVRSGDEPAWADPPEGFQRMIERMQQSWGGPWAVEHFAPSRAHDEHFRAWWAMILRAASSPSSVKAVLSNLSEVDIRPLLPQVRVRTLVIHKTGDQLVPVDAGRYFAQHMPNAAWVELPGVDHIYFIESAAILAAVEDFCRAQAPHDPAGTWIAIILLVLARTQGFSTDALQTQIGGFHPRQISPLPDGVLALFDSPARAFQCAARLRSTAAGAGLQISLHVGECSVAGGRPITPILEIARHAAATVSPGEIAVTQTLRDILAGSNLAFEELAGQQARHGPPGIALYTVR